MTHDYELDRLCTDFDKLMTILAMCVTWKGDKEVLVQLDDVIITEVRHGKSKDSGYEYTTISFLDPVTTFHEYQVFLAPEYRNVFDACPTGTPVTIMLELSKGRSGDIMLRPCSWSVS